MSDQAPVDSSDKSVRWGWTSELIDRYDKQVYALAIAGCYLIGFVALNAHLAKIGIYDFEVVSVRIVLASADCLFYLICFYLFAGRAILFGPAWSKEEYDALKASGITGAWLALPYLRQTVRSVYFCCFSSIAFITALIDVSAGIGFYLALLAYLIFELAARTFSLSIRSLRAYLICRLSFECVIIFVFFYTDFDGVAIKIFGAYLGIMIYLIMTSIQLEAKNSTRETMIFVILNCTILLLAIAGSFGTIVYGLINPRLGGGQSVAVEFLLPESVLKTVPTGRQSLLKADNRANLVFETDTAYYMEIGGLTVRLRSADVPIMLYSPPRTAVSIEKRFAQLADSFRVKPQQSTIRSIPPPAVQPP